MLKFGTFVLLSILFITTQTATIRNLQSDDNLCARWNSDRTLCLQCTFRAYYDIVTGKCQ